MYWKYDPFKGTLYLTGDVDGPASATDNALVRYDGTSGKRVQASSIIVSDTDGITGVTTFAASGAVTLGSTLSVNDTATFASTIVSQSRVHNGDGSTASPCYSFGADTDTGFYRDSANSIGIAIGGAIGGIINANAQWTLGFSGGVQVHPVNGGLSLTTTLAVAGATTLAALSATTISSSGASTLNSLVVTNSATIGTTLGVTGAVTFNSTLSVVDTATFTSSILLNGNLQMGTATRIDSAAAGTLSIGTANASIINIGTGVSATAINIGGAGDTVYIAGTLAWVDTTDLTVTDKTITVNKGGSAGSGNAAGIEIEENSGITGYAKIGNSRNSWEFLAPNLSGTIRLTPGSAAFATAIISTASGDRTWTLPNVSDTFVGLDATQTLTAKTLTSPAINGGAINSATVGATNPSSGAFTTLSSSGLATLASVAISGGAINSTTIGAATPATGAFTTLTTTGSATLGAVGFAGAHTLYGDAANFSSGVGRAVQFSVQINGATKLGLYCAGAGTTPFLFSNSTTLNLSTDAASTAAIAIQTNRASYFGGANIGDGYHWFRGAVVLTNTDSTSSGSIGSTDFSFITGNAYYDNVGNFRAISGNAGYSFLEVARRVSTSSSALTLYVGTGAQTGGSNLNRAGETNPFIVYGSGDQDNLGGIATGGNGSGHRIKWKIIATNQSLGTGATANIAHGVTEGNIRSITGTYSTSSGGTSLGVIDSTYGSASNARFSNGSGASACTNGTNVFVYNPFGVTIYISVIIHYI